MTQNENNLVVSGRVKLAPQHNFLKICLDPSGRKNKPRQYQTQLEVSCLNLRSSMAMNCDGSSIIQMFEYNVSCCLPVVTHPSVATTWNVFDWAH